MAAQASYQPVYPKYVLPFDALVSAGNTAEDGTGTVVQVVAAPADCLYARVRNLRIVANSTTTAGRVKFWRKYSSTFRKVLDVVVAAVTATAGALWSTRDSSAIGANPATGDIAADIHLSASDSLQAATHNAETFLITGELEVY